MVDQSTLAEAAESGSVTDIAKPIIAGQLRHIITGVGVFLATKGVIDPSQTSAFVDIFAGIGMYLLGAGWSWWHKIGQKRVNEDIDRLKSLIVSASKPAPTGDTTK